MGQDLLGELKKPGGSRKINRLSPDRFRWGNACVTISCCTTQGVMSSFSLYFRFISQSPRRPDVIWHFEERRLLLSSCLIVVVCCVVVVVVVSLMSVMIVNIIYLLFIYCCNINNNTYSIIPKRDCLHLLLLYNIAHTAYYTQ